MPILNRARLMTVATCGLGALLTVGCCKDKCAYMQPTDPVPMGTYSDPVWKQQELNAEASDFVIHEHEFNGNTSQLNSRGESHVRQVAARMGETGFPVIIETSSMSKRDGDEYGFPVNGDQELDQRRRELIVHSLIELGANDVENRVIVGPALTPGYEQIEAQAAYYRGLSGFMGN
ncbi:MAG: hypothetical protein HQ518_10865, partial [Rhodopirellula sp.]|nr:hypothetical protein [Rhodopirellula sp.]